MLMHGHWALMLSSMIISCRQLGSQLGKNVIAYDVENAMHTQCVYVPQ